MPRNIVLNLPILQPSSICIGLLLRQQIQEKTTKLTRNDGLSSVIWRGKQHFGASKNALEMERRVECCGSFFCKLRLGNQGDMKLFRLLTSLVLVSQLWHAG